MDNFTSAKRKSGQMLRSKERQIVVNFFNYLKRLKTDKSVNWIVSETAETTGISKTSVFKIRSESARGPLVTPNKKRQIKGVRRNSGEVKYDDFIRSSIRRKVHEFYFRNQPPTLNLVLTATNKDRDLTNFKKSTVYVLLREIGFE
jgi:hypothetical protein